VMPALISAVKETTANSGVPANIVRGGFIRDLLERPMAAIAPAWRSYSTTASALR